MKRVRIPLTIRHSLCLKDLKGDIMSSSDIEIMN